MQFRLSFSVLLIALSCALPASATEDSIAVMDQPPAPGLEHYTHAVGELVDEAMGYLGIRYRRGGSTPETGLDCSGLVMNVFRNAVGLDLPRTATEMSRVGESVKRQELKPGDLVFFNTMRRTFSHVGIYLGDGQFVHSPSRGGKVRVEDMASSYWAKRFTGARRVIDEDGASGMTLAR
jgi:cell wall-associated NlpC family hydrolase